MSINAFSAGKAKYGTSKTNVSYSAGKQANATGAKPMRSAGLKTGTNTKGDPKGAPCMGMGKK